MIEFLNLMGALGTFVLWVMVWRGTLRSLASKPWYARHLSGLLRGAAAWALATAVLIALNWKSIKETQKRNAATAVSAKAWEEAVSASRANVPTPSAAPPKVVVAAAAAAPQPPPVPTLGPDVPLSDMAAPEPKPVDLSTLYRVKSDKVMATFKRTIELELFKHESEATLAGICREAKALNPVVVDRTFVTFDVRGEPKPPQMSHWAIARFDPELSVSILGDD